MEKAGFVNGFDAQVSVAELALAISDSSEIVSTRMYRNRETVAQIFVSGLGTVAIVPGSHLADRLRTTEEAMRLGLSLRYKPLCGLKQVNFCEALSSLPFRADLSQLDQIIAMTERRIERPGHLPGRFSLNRRGELLAIGIADDPLGLTWSRATGFMFEVDQN